METSIRSMNGAGVVTLAGLSKDIINLPKNVDTGSTYWAIDTGATYAFEETTKKWYKQ